MNNVFAIDPSVLTVFVLVTCLACIYMVFFFGRRLQTAAYLRDSLVEGAKQQELKALLGEVHDRRIEGPLDPSHPPPDGYGSTQRLWERERFIRVEPAPEPSEYFSDSESDAERARREKREAERILKTLEGKDIATILAAIAGYVLGKASSTVRQPNRAREARAKMVGTQGERDS